MAGQAWVQYEQAQAAFLRDPLYDDGMLDDPFLARNTPKLVSPRTVSEWLHDTVLTDPHNLNWNSADLSNHPFWALSGVAYRISDRFSASWFPTWLSPRGQLTGEQALILTSQLRAGWTDKSERLYYSEVAKFLPDILEDPVVWSALNGKSFDRLYDYDIMALIVKQGIIPEWTLFPYYLGGGVSYAASENFARVAVHASEEALTPLVPQFNQYQLFDLFRTSWDRTTPYSLPFLLDIQGRLADKPGGTPPVGEGYLMGMLSDWTTMPVDMFRWAMETAQIDPTGETNLWHLALARAFADGMLDGWVTHSELEGFPKNLIFEILSSQFPTRDSIRDLPLQEARPVTMPVAATTRI